MARTPHVFLPTTLKEGSDSWLFTDKNKYHALVEEFVKLNQIHHAPESNFKEHLLKTRERIERKYFPQNRTGLETASDTKLLKNKSRKESRLINRPHKSAPEGYNFKSKKIGGTKGGKMLNTKLTRDAGIRLHQDHIQRVKKRSVFIQRARKESSSPSKESSTSESKDDKYSMQPRKRKMTQSENLKFSLVWDRKSAIFPEMKFSLDYDVLQGDKKTKADVHKRYSKASITVKDQASEMSFAARFSEEPLGQEYFYNHSLANKMIGLENYIPLKCTDHLVKEVRFSKPQTHEIYFKTIDDENADKYMKHKTWVQNVLDKDLKLSCFRTDALKPNRSRYNNISYNCFESETDDHELSQSTDNGSVIIGSTERLEKHCKGLIHKNQCLNPYYHKSIYETEKKIEKRIHAEEVRLYCPFLFNEWKKTKLKPKREPSSISTTLLKKEIEHDKLKTPKTYFNIDLDDFLKEDQTSEFEDFKRFRAKPEDLVVEKWDDSEYKNNFRTKKLIHKLEKLFDENIAEVQDETHKITLKTDKEDENDVDLFYQNLQSLVFEDKLKSFKNGTTSYADPAFKTKPVIPNSLISSLTSKEKEIKEKKVTKENIDLIDLKPKLTVYRDFTEVPDKTIKYLENLGMLYEMYLYDRPENPLYVSHMTKNENKATHQKTKSVSLSIDSKKLGSPITSTRSRRSIAKAENSMNLYLHSNGKHPAAKGKKKKLKQKKTVNMAVGNYDSDKSSAAKTTDVSTNKYQSEEDSEMHDLSIDVTASTKTLSLVNNTPTSQVSQMNEVTDSENEKEENLSGASGS